MAEQKKDKGLLHLYSRDIVVVAMMAAVICGGKFALSFVPNVEIVSLLLLVFTVAVGFKKTFFAAYIFCATEVLIYGFSYYLFAYVIYWPLFVAVVKIVSLKNVKSEYFYTATVAALTVVFGLLTTLFDCIVGGMPFFARYVSGLLFFGVHIFSNCLMALFLFKPLCSVVSKVGNGYLMER